MMLRISRASKILKIHQHSYSMAKTINIELKAPQSWRELTQEQLRYVFYLMATFADMTVVKTYMFVRFTGISVIEKNRYGWRSIRFCRKIPNINVSSALVNTSVWNSNISYSTRRRNRSI